ncbi:expressed protein [Dictyostelium purpureum]|uniref:Expressed protein n=1 Tax=Dictyostelium purpureum TaxID=5786 RepID=F0Z6D5_DICPU|nr:uncharacterized protein DICPUDRAFT_146598 [Dictyostelium purpureum]EGC40424.1 expressed protein [Dictyostelium purpureum]|eukprot:XP_003282971.1 expressed protein [Dictyostelium purpureum]
MVYEFTIVSKYCVVHANVDAEPRREHENNIELKKDQPKALEQSKNNNQKREEVKNTSSPSEYADCKIKCGKIKEYQLKNDCRIDCIGRFG